MKHLDEIIYDAISTDSSLMEAIGNRVTSTCFEVSPEEKDNTKLPNIIVTDESDENLLGTKDYVWEGPEDTEIVGVDIAAKSPRQLDELTDMVRQAIEQYIVSMYQNGERTPQLDKRTATGKEWDWMKPCYHKCIIYQCTIYHE